MASQKRLIFISYSSRNRQTVDELAADLRLILDPRQYEIWYDPQLNRAGGHKWWKTIIQKITACDIFIYAISASSLDSLPCQRELRYGYEDLQKPLLPIIIETVEAKYLPVILAELHFLSYVPLDRSLLTNIRDSIFELPDPPSLPDPLPEPPKTPLDEVTLLMDEISSEQLSIDDQEAILNRIRLLKNRLDARQHISKLLGRLMNRRDIVMGVYLEAEALLKSLSQFDPPSLEVTVASAETTDTWKEIPIDVTISSSLPSNLLSEQFKWVEIPEGSVQLAGTTVEENVGSFFMSRYLITVADFACFLQDNGYSDRPLKNDFWTPHGRDAQKRGWYRYSNETKSGARWEQPAYWIDSRFNQSTQPVVGISFYEAAAFVQWLSQKMLEFTILLPTEQQWQRAAQRQDRRLYPWGNEWKANCCINQNNPSQCNKPLPVGSIKQSGRDDQLWPTDLSGNVWEWCLNKPASSVINTQGSEQRAIRGGSWRETDPSKFTTTYREWEYPFERRDDLGFRIVAVRKN